MEQYTVHIGETFDGPLDLLLHLIQKDQMSIADIPIERITKQYLEYIYSWQRMNIDVAVEFIVMASQLLEIKSRMLLPPGEEEEESLDPRAQLALSLYEYKLFKDISLYFANRQENYMRIVTKEPIYIEKSVTVSEEEDIDGNMLSALMRKYIAEHHSLNEKMKAYSTLERDGVTVDDKIFEIKSALIHEDMISFNKLLKKQKNLLHVLSLFLAALELMKQNIVVLKQERNFQDILLISLIGE